MHRGFIKLHRKIAEWEWYDDGNTFRLFIHFLLKANHKDKKWRGITVERGSFVTGYDKLSQELKLSKQQIRTSIKKLKSTHEVTHQHNNLYSIVTLINYDLYQDRDLIESSQATHQVTSEQQSSNSQVTPTKNVKNDKKVKNNKDICATGVAPMKVVDLYNQEFKGTSAVQKRAPIPTLLNRISVLTKQHFHTLDDWTNFFNKLKLSPFLMSEIPPKAGYRQFRLKLEWIVNPTNLAKIIDQHYHGSD